MAKISAAGIYDIAIEAYRHDPQLCDGPSISSSGLKAVLDCPAKYWAFSCLNPNRFEDKSSKAIDLGRAAHALVLGEPEFAKYFVISPHEEFRTNAAKEWRDAQTRTILKAAEFQTVLAIAKAQRESPAVMQAFERGQPEKSLIWKDEETGVYVRSRPDWLPDDPSQLFAVEYKTAVSIEPRKFSADAFKFGYHIQAAIVDEAVREVMRVKKPLGVAHVVQEKEPPYLADLRMFAPEHIALGRAMYRRALRIFADCLNSGRWPAYTKEPQFIETPAWIAREIEENVYGDDRDSRKAKQYSEQEYFAAG